MTFTMVGSPHLLPFYIASFKEQALNSRDEKVLTHPGSCGHHLLVGR